MVSLSFVAHLDTSLINSGYLTNCRSLRSSEIKEVRYYQPLWVKEMSPHLKPQELPGTPGLAAFDSVSQNNQVGSKSFFLCCPEDKKVNDQML